MGNEAISKPNSFIDDPLYGRVSVNHHICTRSFTVQPSEAHTLISKIKKASIYHVPQVVRILKYDQREQDQFCSNYVSVRVQMEYSNQTLKQIRDIEQFLDQLIQGLMFQDYRGVDNCALSPNRILIFADGQLKLLDHQLLTENSDFERLYIGVVSQDDWMVAPEVMRSLRTNQAFQNQKATIFNVGIMIIALITNIHPKQAQIYDYDNLELTNQFNQYVELIQQMPISIQLRQLITQFLQINPELRPSYKEILDQLQSFQIVQQEIQQSPSPKKEETQYDVPANQIISFNPCYDDVKKVLSESIHQNSPAKQSPTFQQQQKSQKKGKQVVKQENAKPKKIYNLENTSKRVKRLVKK